MDPMDWGMGRFIYRKDRRCEPRSEQGRGKQKRNWKFGVVGSSSVLRPSWFGRAGVFVVVVMALVVEV